MTTKGSQDWALNGTVQGTEDRILPIDATGRRLPALIQGVTYTEIDGGPHNIGWMHYDEVNRALLAFLGH